MLRTEKKTQLRRSKMDLILPRDRTRETRFFAEAIPNLVWTAGPDGYIDYFNQHWYDYTSLTWDEFNRNGLRPVVHEDDYDACRERWLRAIETGEPYSTEYRIKRASDGAYRWHLAQAVPVKDDDGRIVRWFGTCTDIDDQKRAIAAISDMNRELEMRVAERTHELQEARDRDRTTMEHMRNLLANMTLGAVMADEKLTIILVNEGFAKIMHLGYSPEEFVGRAAPEVFRRLKPLLMNAEDYEKRLFDTVRAAQPVTGVDVQLVDGRTLTRDYVPVHVDGALRGHMLLYRDVTQERRIDAAKSEFMSLASHQLRTPLTQIRWSLNLLEKKLDKDSPLREHLQTAKRGVIGMTDTIRMMLAISRLESKGLDMRMSMVTLRSFLDQLVADQRAEIDRKQLHVTVDCPSDATVHTDQQALKEILSNLISNAVKYTPAGGRIALHCAREDNRMSIAVRDSGVGIPAHQQDKVFSKFFRGENVLQSVTDGNGLGLYLTYRLVQMVNGTIDFTSTEGAGTTFTLTLPA